MQPVSVDVESPKPDRRQQLRGLASSHRRWALRFAGLSLCGLTAFALMYAQETTGAHVARLWSLGWCAFFGLNAATSALKYRVLTNRLREAERAEP
ncbi:MAG TPA: hypothetical protein VER96_31650 [Polyangiaceae bacterium]|nr:hypothetical protein [Polyangiaceae bacterium]